MRIDTNKSGSTVGSWVKKSLCAGIVMGLAMSAGMSFAGQKPKADNGKVMTPFARIAHIKVVKDKYGKIDREATDIKAKAVATAIATYVATVNDTTSGFPADWIVGGMEGGTTIEGAIMRIPSPELIDPENPDLGVKKANVIDLCNAHYAKMALGVNPITGVKGEPDAKYVVNGFSHAPALPCELATWNDDKNKWLRNERGITFEEVVFHLTHGGLLDAIQHPNQKQYPGQKLYFVNVEGYIHIVPHVVEAEYVFLKTIIPSRKATRDFQKEGEQNETR